MADQHRINELPPQPSQPLIDDDQDISKKPPYDQFKVELPEDDKSTSFLQKLFTKTFKLFSIICIGGAVLGAGLLSKASLMVLVNSAKPLASTVDLSDPDLVDHDVLRVWSFIILLVTMLVPEVVSMTYSLYRIIMKPERKLDLNTFLWGLLWEVLHAVGESILILRVFPHLDATFALLSMPLIAIVPIIFHVHSNYNSIKSVSTSNYIPIVQNQNKDNDSSAERTMILRKIRIKKFCLSITALILQLIGFFSLFSGFIFNSGKCDPNASCTSSSYWFCFLCSNNTYIWALVGILLFSIRYWENFVAENFNFKRIEINFLDLHDNIDKVRFKTSFIYSFVKCLIVTGMTFLVFVVIENDTYVSASVLKDTKPYTHERYSNIIHLFQVNDGRPNVRNQVLERLWYVFAVQTCASIVTFYMGYLACVTMIQRASFTIPLMLITPILSAISASVGVYKNKDTRNDLCSFLGLSFVNKTQNLRYYIDWNNVISFSTDKGITNPVVTPTAAAVAVIVGLFAGYFGILLISDYLWKNPENRLERIKVLFVKPFFCAPLIDKVVLLNRRKNEKRYLLNEKKENQNNDRNKATISSREEVEIDESSSVTGRPNPQLFLCATMWHESKEEMIQLLISIMRLDRDQGSRNNNDDNDYYEFETHILFDDAMERKRGQKHRQPNEFVHQLCKVIPEAAKRVQASRNCNLSPPIFYSTPYGGTLLFEMPHKNKMIVHLKDKEKIRHRKRWSQCMYMYYILGYLQATKKAYKLEDIFLLALDGDVDFQPKAILYLLDRMKKNPDVGAACGRIHPKGSGPVVWFQKFEYAVGHWFQKTAEHILGCVLCSPGCFSLFRGLALKDANIVNQYTTKPTEARHYVQWDQGEDRWLCTLLLKRGWKIDYCAASDSFTFAPEDFKEFFNQRRRWGPSTIANIIDLLSNAKIAVKKNNYISWGFIIYQFALTMSSLLGPATVILVVQSSLEYVFKWNTNLCLILSLTPVAIFIILCYTTSSDTQIKVAAVLTILYAVTMMAVLVALIGSLATRPILDPINLFMIALVGLYVITGILHPQEIMCLAHGLLYYLCVPSAFILLMVYSLTNLNNVSWGTRETKKLDEDERTEYIQKEENNSNELGYSLLGANLTINPKSPQNCCCRCGPGNFCQGSFCCKNTSEPLVVHATNVYINGVGNGETANVKSSSHSSPVEVPPSRHLKVIDQTTEEANSKFNTKNEEEPNKPLMKTKVPAKDKPSTISKPNCHSSKDLSPDSPCCSYLNDDADLNLEHSSSAADKQVNEIKSENEQNLYSCIKTMYRNATNGQLDNEEKEFWEYIIDQYLHPLNENKQDKDRIQNDLKGLRNRVTVYYFLLNGLWIFFNFALQKIITDITINIVINGTLFTVNPISFVFILLFLVILVIQFGSMLQHRWPTALHFLAATSLRWNDGRNETKEDENNDEVLASEAIAEERNGDNRVLEVSDREMNHSNGSDNSGFIKDSDSMEIETAEAIDRIEEEEQYALAKSGEHEPTSENNAKNENEKEE